MNCESIKGLLLGIYCLALWVKFTSDDLWEYFSYFFSENWFWYFMQIVSTGDNLHEASEPVFWEK